MRRVYPVRKVLLTGVFVAMAVFGIYRVASNDTPVSSPAQNNNNPATNSDAPKEPASTFINLQSTVEAWASKVGGKSSVLIYDLENKKVAASYRADEPYFTASIYKLYVAYIGYQRVADGTYSMDDPYLSGYTRGECLDAMIRSSYSPCGEKMWAELGKEDLNLKLRAYGLKNTSMTGLRTTAGDAAIILQRLFEQRDLTEKHRQSYLDSMKTQEALYRRGLPSGFDKSIVYNKVGWNGFVEWHDTAIVTLPNGRSYVITVFTQNVGMKKIAELAAAVETKLNK